MQLGLNYTPVPLVTMKALHKIGAGGQSREQVELALSYRLGVPLVKQISPEYVAQAKSLRGSRYDPIERKNVPVLEFRQRKTLQVFGHAAVEPAGGRNRAAGAGNQGVERNFSRQLAGGYAGAEPDAAA